MLKSNSFKAAFAVTGLLCGWSGLSQAAITFQFNYLDATWSEAAKTSLNNAASLMASYFPSYTTTVVMDVTGSNANTTTLASAGSQYTGITAGFSNLGVVGSKIQTGIDLNGAGADGTVDANFFHNWSFGTTVTLLQYDFTDTMFHELGHAMGFNSLVAQNGLSAFHSSTPGAFSPFDQYLTNGSGVSLVNATTFTTNGDWTTASVGGTGTVPATPNTGLYFGGPNAKAANGGSAVPLFSPTTWQDGSSGSHLDDDFFTGPNAKTMNAATPFGPGVRQFSPIEIGIWRDLGYAIVPEPGSTLLAFSALGLTLFRRRRM